MARGRSGRPAKGPAGLLANAGALLTSRLLMAAMGWIGTLLIVRSLSVEDFGKFTLIFSVLGIMSIVTEMGVGRVAVTGLLDDGPGRERFAGSYILLRTAMGVVGYLLALGAVWIAGYESDVVVATAVAGVVVLLATPSHAYHTVFEANRRMSGVAVALAASRFAQLGLTAALAAGGGSLLLFTLPAVFAEILVLATLIPMAHRLTGFHYRPDVRGWWSLLREAAPLAVGTALATIYFRVDTVMLSQLDTFESVAIYGVAYKFVELAHFLPYALSAALLPLLVSAYPDRLEQLRWTVQRGATIAAVLAVGIIATFGLFAEPVISLLYGADYAAGADAARIVVLSETVSFATQLAVIVLVATGRQKIYPLIAGLGLLLNIGLNLVLIPRFSYQGAAVATLITDVVVVLAMLREMRRVPGMRPIPRPPMLRLVAAGALAAAVGYGLALLTVWPVGLGATVLVYAGAVVLLRAAGPGGIAALRHDTVPGSRGPST